MQAPVSACTLFACGMKVYILTSTIFIMELTINSKISDIIYSLSRIVKLEIDVTSPTQKTHVTWVDIINPLPTNDYHSSIRP